MQPTIESASQANFVERRLQGSKRNAARLVYGVASVLLGMSVEVEFIFTMQ